MRRRFKDYFDFDEPLGTIPSHRMLAIRRGEAEGELQWQVEAPAEQITGRLTREVTEGRRGTGQLALVAADAYKRLLAVGDRGGAARGAQDARRRRGHHHLRAQPRAAAALVTGRREARDRLRSRLPHRREGGGGERHGGARAHRHAVPAPGGPLRRCRARDGAALHTRAHRHRQRHRQPRDGDAREGGAPRARPAARRRWWW